METVDIVAALIVASAPKIIKSEGNSIDNMNSADQAVNEIWEMGVNLNPGMYYDSGHILTADVPPKKRVWVWVYIFKLSV